MRFWEICRYDKHIAEISTPFPGELLVAFP